MGVGRRLLLVSTAAVFGLTSCSTRFGAPDPASEQGERTLSLWRGTFIAGIVVGLIVLGLIIYVLVRYRRRSDDVPNQGAHNLPVELVYTSIPVLIVAALFGFNVFTQEKITATVDDPDVHVEVLGFQWQWQFRYLDDSGSPEVVVTGVLGEPSPELVLPVRRTTQLDLMADDVIHSFWVPRFLTKRDLIPGVDNTIDVTPEQTGTFAGVCAEYCGLDHWRMRFSVRVVTADEFDRWLDEQRRREPS